MKNISIIGNEIPILKGKLNYINFNTKASLSDTDILIFDPFENKEPQDSIVRFDWNTSYEKEKESHTELQLHWRNEISHFLNQGGVLFVLLSEVKGSIKTSNYYPIPSIPLSGIGYKKGNQITRIGFSHSMVQNFTQNAVHKYATPTPYFLDYKNFKTGGYVYSGAYNRFSLW